jgi:hypothetical protein
MFLSEAIVSFSVLASKENTKKFQSAKKKNKENEKEKMEGAEARR